MYKDLSAKNNCIICGKHCENGIIIKGKVICSSCEEKLVSCEIGTDFYEYYKDCIKKHLVPSILRDNVEMNEYLR
ncbi:protein CsfB [Clostridium polyendosporum]|uniref:Protein CsfB n=1 Tax=Clostridium polyendosporum TaxID=69208 RepID=A0A919S3N4_9CLOT|nr:sigma factor G inhibitor Gin [Clostridium polyendosporum]GIM30023.1 protein CsfB [Clostridium polyendosporum]